MQLQVEKMQVANTNLLQQLERVESQVSQLQQDTLVDRLVDAKLQLAQADLQATSLRYGPPACALAVWGGVIAGVLTVETGAYLPAMSTNCESVSNAGVSCFSCG